MAESISDDSRNPLEIEVLEFKYAPVKSFISLLMPKGLYCDEYRIANLSPQTALNLKNWLIENSETIEKLAKQESESK